MKRFFAILTALALCAGVSYAQDMQQATDLAKAANEALTEGNYVEALDGFKAALVEADACGEAGADIVFTCKGIIPKIMVEIAKDFISASDYDNAIATLEEAVKVADEYEEYETLDKASSLIPQVLMKQGGDLLNAKNYAGAAVAYQKVLDGDPANGMAALRLGAALAGSGDIDNAKAAYKLAAENGQEKTAIKQLSTLALKAAAASLKAKDYAAAVEASNESLQYGESDKAYQIAGQASQLAGKSDEAIKYFEKYLEVAPNASNAGQIAFTVGALYQQAKNVAKAKEFYQKAVTDPKYGAEAKKLMDSLK